MSRIPYIGNKISLVSRLDIRYEGILVNVDSKESTIALEHVRSFGTEDRVSLHHVPPRNEIFDNITFRASDIKDLIVCDSLSPLTSERFEGLYDPAIISVSRNIGHARSNIDRETNDYIQKCTDLQSTTTTQEISQPESDIVGDIGARHVHMKFQQSQSEHHPYSNTDFQSELNVYRSIPNNIRRSNKNQSFSPSSHSHPSFLFKKGYNRGQEPPSIYPPCYHQNAQQSLRRGQRSRFPKPLYTLFEPITFDSEFDFDKANEQFNNEFVQDIITGECPSPIGKPDNVMSAIGSSTTTTNSTCYNKSASFFDTISCGSFGKPLGYQERPNLKNQETFGSVPFPYKQINNAQNIDHEPQHNYHYQTAC